jgi:hypothetical protein
MKGYQSTFHPIPLFGTSLNNAVINARDLDVLLRCFLSLVALFHSSTFSVHSSGFSVRWSDKVSER